MTESNWEGKRCPTSRRRFWEGWFSYRDILHLGMMALLFWSLSLISFIKLYELKSHKDCYSCGIQNDIKLVYLASYHRCLPRIDQAPSPNPLGTRFFPPCFGHWATCPPPWALWPLRPRTQPENRGRSTQNHRRGKTKRPHSERDSKEIILNQPRSEKIQHQCHLRCLWNLTHPGTPSQEHFAHDLWNTFEAKFPAPIFGCQTSHNNRFNRCKSVFKNNDSWQDTIPHTG